MLRELQGGGEPGGPGADDDDACGLRARLDVDVVRHGWTPVFGETDGAGSSA